jgi:hypothetical protein
MNRRAPQCMVFTVAVAIVMLGNSTARAQTQPFMGKWIHQGQRGVSALEFSPGERGVIGPLRGHFHYSVVLDDGRLLDGEGSYVYRSILPNRGWLVLHFADGRVSREHEVTRDSTSLNIAHYGVTWTYVRQGQ